MKSKIKGWLEQKKQKRASQKIIEILQPQLMWLTTRCHDDWTNFKNYTGMSMVLSNYVIL